MASKIPSEREIFTKNYSNFCGILKNEDSLLPNLVDKHIITFDDIDEVKSKPAGEKGPTLLKHISGPLEAGHTDGFYGLLEIMETHGKPDTQKFARGIRKECPRNNNCGMLHNKLLLHVRICVVTVLHSMWFTL